MIFTSSDFNETNKNDTETITITIIPLKTKYPPDGILDIITTLISILKQVTIKYFICFFQY